MTTTTSRRISTASDGGGGPQIERLPNSLLVEILTRLDFESLCCAAPVCRIFNKLVAQALSSTTTLDLSGFTFDIHTLQRVLGDNKVLRSLTLDCRHLYDSSAKIFAKNNLHKLVLLNCQLFSTSVLTEIGEACPNLRIFMMEVICIPDLGSSQDWKRNITTVLLKACLHLETLWIKIPYFGHYEEDIWNIDLPKTLKVLLLQPASEQEIKTCLLRGGCSRNAILATTTSNVPNHPRLLSFQLQSLSLVLDYITDDLLSVIVSSLHHLIELCLEDSHMEKRQRHHDLTNDGLQLLGSFNQLISLSLTRKYLKFEQVNDLGIMFLAEKCTNLEFIRLSGFARVTDAGYRSILHSCRKVQKLEIVDAFALTDLSFYGISDALCSLVDLKLISCSLLTCFTAKSLCFFKNLEVLDFSGCKCIGDEGLISISELSNLTKLDLGNTNITDIGLSTLGNCKSPVISLSIRGCNGVSDLGISALLPEHGILSRTLSSLDLGNMGGITDGSIYTIANVCKSLSELCLRGCFHITDASITALGSANDTKGRRHPLRKLDLYHCTGLSHQSYQLLVLGTSFQSLRWLGVCETCFGHRCEMLQPPVPANRPWSFVCINGCEMGCRDGWWFHQFAA